MSLANDYKNMDKKRVQEDYERGADLAGAPPYADLYPKKFYYTP